MDLGAFSVSLSVKNLDASLAFYQTLGFEPMWDTKDQGYLIVKNGDTVIGLFSGMFDGNILTFNPGWDKNANETETFTDIRDLQARIKATGLMPDSEADPDSTGPASFTLRDPDGNVILIDQHR